MSKIDLVLTQLGALHHKMKTSKKKISDKEWQPLYKQVCAVFREAAPEQRVDIQIALENRDPLMRLFVRYLDQMTQAAHKAALKDRRKAVPLLEEALTADAIIDGRTNVDELRRIHKQLEAAVREARYDMEGFLRGLETPVQVYIDRAHHLHQAGQRSQAIRTLGRALQLDEHLYKNEHIANFAATLTGQSPKSAIITLEDTYLRNLYIESYENPHQFQRETVEARQVRPHPSAKRGFGAGVILAAFAVLLIVGAAGYWLVYLR